VIRSNSWSVLLFAIRIRVVNASGSWRHAGAEPLMPLRLFRLRSVAAANAIGLLWATAMFAWFFISALYLQHVLGYSPMEVGLAFLPANLIMTPSTPMAIKRRRPPAATGSTGKADIERHFADMRAQWSPGQAACATERQPTALGWRWWMLAALGRSGGGAEVSRKYGELP
jgi:hypothetical protein